MIYDIRVTAMIYDIAQVMNKWRKYRTNADI